MCWLTSAVSARTYVCMYECFKFLFVQYCTLSPSIYICIQCGLKERLADLVPSKQTEVKDFRAKSGDTVVGNVTVNMVSMAPLVRNG